MNVRGKVLSPRQEEVMQLTAEGKTRKEIASVLGVRIDTVAHYRGAAYRKLGLSRFHHPGVAPDWQQREVMRMAREGEK